jgi:Dolichyl-phosphate-mannose-protein mannosyltransferase
MTPAKVSPFPATAMRAQARSRLAENVPLFAIAVGLILIHVVTDNRYGFHRDELQFLTDARHMDWGFVAYPPFTAFVERIGMALFGLSIVGLRLFSVLAQAVAVFVSGLMARELGGKKLAQITTALAVAFSPLSLFEGTEFQYTSFDFLWWVLIAYFVIRLLNSENPRWWLAIGAVIGLGLETKYAIVFYVAGLLAGMAFTSARRYFASGWFWGGAALALVIFLPNFVWLARHDFISYHFLQHIHARDVGEGRAEGFLKGQFFICANLAVAPLWLAGLIGFMLNRKYRMMAFLFVVPVAIFWISKGRHYYTAGVYPMVTAMGAVIAERWLGILSRGTRRTIEVVYFLAFVFVSAYVCAIILPLAAGGPLRQFALKNNGDLREEFGWNELVQTVAQIRDSLPAEQRAHVGVLVGNYGERGAIELLGTPYHLPQPISMTNSGWLVGYPSPTPTTLIVVGLGRQDVDALFTGCRLAGHNGNIEGVRNEESISHPDIFVCGPPQQGWAQFWKDNLWFG